MAESIFDDGENSDYFSPAAVGTLTYSDSINANNLKKPKAKAKAAPKPAAKKTAAPKAGPKKMAQTTLKTKPVASKKRPKPDTEDENSADENPSLHDDSLLSVTPPSSKKQKRGPKPKKIGAKPLREVENEAIAEAIDASMHLDGAGEAKPKKGSKATETYQKVSCHWRLQSAYTADNQYSSPSWSISLSAQIPTLDLWRSRRRECGYSTASWNLWR